MPVWTGWLTVREWSVTQPRVYVEDDLIADGSPQSFIKVFLPPQAHSVTSPCP